MTDIVERLRDGTLSPYRQWELCGEAADEIERLRKEVECLQLTIKGFRSGIAAAQAREAKLRSVLEDAIESESFEHNYATEARAQVALDTPHDNSALKERLTQERERCAKACRDMFCVGSVSWNLLNECFEAMEDEQ